VRHFVTEIFGGGRAAGRSRYGGIRSGRAQFRLRPLSLRLSIPRTPDLFAGGFCDDGAGDTRRGGAAGLGGYSVNHHGGATVAENGVGVVTERDMRSDDSGVSGAVGGDDQRKVGNVARREAARVFMASATIGIEMRTGGLEVGSFAFCNLVDVQGVFAGGKAFDVELDANAIRSLRKSGGADDLILSVFDINGEGLDWGRCRGIGDGAGKEQTENGEERFHGASLESTADEGLWPGFGSETTVNGREMKGV
jgi:hypothetical protein